MSTLVGGTGIIGQDMICSFSNGKYTELEGTEIVAENCVKARVKDLVVKGKTYQNLVGEITYIRPGWQIIGETYKGVAGEGFSSIAFEGTSLLKANQTYTIIVDIVKNTLVSTVKPIKIVVASNENSWGSIDIDLDQTGRIIAKLTPPEISVSAFSLTRRACTEGEIIISNFIILEGDYTNTDLPTSITEIESVAEKESNILSLKVNDVVSNISLPIPLRSLPNNVCDTIEGDKLVQRVGKVVLGNTNASNFSQVNTMQVFRWSNFFETKEFVSGISDAFPVQNIASISVCEKAIRLSGTNFYSIDIKLPDDTGFNTDTFRSWLSENPVTVYYELAEPIIHSLEIPSISTTKGTNIITTENNIKPKMTMKVKVK